MATKSLKSFTKSKYLHSVAYHPKIPSQEVMNFRHLLYKKYKVDQTSLFLHHGNCSMIRCFSCPFGGNVIQSSLFTKAYKITMFK